MAMIKLQSKDGRIFEVDIEIAKLSITLKNMLKDLDADGIKNNIIPLPNVNGSTLEKVIEWLKFHKDDPRCADDYIDDIRPNFLENISEWDAKFLEVSPETLFSFILAANYLEIKGLTKLTCKNIAKICRNKTEAQIRSAFNIPGKSPEDSNSDSFETPDDQMNDESETSEEL